eukprot:4629637-Ditylum_brightwellii.AAC.1
MDHGTKYSITGKQLRACIERHKMKVGTKLSLFHNNYKIIQPLLTDTWIKNTFSFLCDNRCIIEERTPNLQLKRENGQFLMEAFIQAGYRGEKLASLN